MKQEHVLIQFSTKRPFLINLKCQKVQFIIKQRVIGLEMENL